MPHVTIYIVFFSLTRKNLFAKLLSTSPSNDIFENPEIIHFNVHSISAVTLSTYAIYLLNISDPSFDAISISDDVDLPGLFDVVFVGLKKF